MGPKVVLAGNNLAAIYTLELLLEVCDRTEILAIAPKPGRPAEWTASLEEAAHTHGVPCIAPEDVNDSQTARRVRDHDPTLLLSVYYTQIFSKAILAAVNGPLLNFHPSMLPRHRGTAPLVWAIVEGDAVTGLTIHHLDEGVDTGDIVAQYPMPIHPDDTGYQLHMKMANLVRAAAAELLRTWLAERTVPEGEPQTGLATAHSSRDPSVNHIDWAQPRATVRNVVRALSPPLPGAFAYIGDTQVVIASVELVERPGSTPKPSGMVETRGTSAPIVWAGDGPLEITSFVHEGALREGSELTQLRELGEGTILR